MSPGLVTDGAAGREGGPKEMGRVGQAKPSEPPGSEGNVFQEQWGGRV